MTCLWTLRMINCYSAPINFLEMGCNDNKNKVNGFFEF